MSGWIPASFSTPSHTKKLGQYPAILTSHLRYSPMTLPADELGWASCASRETTLKDARGVEPGCVEIIPRKRVTFHVRTWLYSEQMETRFLSLSMTFTTGFRWTMNVWKSCGPCPTVSGCWTITRTVPELVPYAISIQLPLKPDDKNKTLQISSFCREKQENQNQWRQIMDGNVNVLENCCVSVVLKLPQNSHCVYFVWSFI